jgi:uncharacterized protein (DUF58 family)
VSDPARVRGAGAPSAATLGIDESELARLAQVAGRLLGGRALLTPGHQPAPRRAGRGSEFLDYRDYAPGDEYRRIDWRASARSRRPQVRRYRDEASADWFLCVDASASMASADAAKWRLARQLVYAFAYLLISLGQRVGVVAFETGPVAWLPAGRGRHQLTRLAAELARLAPRASGGATSLAAVDELVGPRDPLVVLSDFLREDGLRADLVRLLHRDRELHAILIGARADTMLPGASGRSLMDVESGERLVIRETASAAPAAWRALRDDVDAFCRSRRIVCSVCDTGERWRDIVLRHLQAASRQIG